MATTSQHKGATPAEQVVAVHPLAESLYIAAARSSGLLNQVQNEIGLFLSVLSTTEPHVPYIPKDSAQGARFSKTLDDCHQVLLDLQRFKESPEGVGLQSQISDLRDRLSACMADLTSLNTDLMKFSQETVDRKLQAFIDEIQMGMRDSKVVLDALSGVAPIDDSPEWRKLQQELVTVVGINPALIKEDRKFIVAKLRSAFPQQGNPPSTPGPKPPSVKQETSLVPPRVSDDGHSDKEVAPSTNIPISVAPEVGVEDSDKQVLPNRDLPILVRTESQDPYSMKQALPHDNFPARMAATTEAQEPTTQSQHAPTHKKPSDMRKLFYQLRHGQHDFFYHISWGSLPQVRKCLEKGANVKVMHENGSTPLEMATSYGYEDIVRLLLDWGADINQLSAGRFTALGRAAAIGHRGLVQLLLEKGASVNRGDKKPLSKAAEAGYEDIVQILLALGAEVDLTDSSGYTALGYAVKNGHAATAQLLLDNGAKVGRYSNIRDRHPLYVAVEKGYVDMVRLLLAYGADPHAKNYHGVSPLSLAVSMNWSEVVVIFEQFGYFPESIGYTAVQYA
ncbi:hypothetical protein N7474_005419 [Penicillium riverlandense]|uniref:uncharacterized protein n=1 Tax=Penicillium riverlandense TaxID=1903569 RepID=UPI002546E32F|nr:uncharacterized protein N7474_005419 [Penicillium riverlandense]KAJ5819828.1 hypothetical protein N7474_005419 [Penicillium riverlandense]